MIPYFEKAGVSIFVLIMSQEVIPQLPFCLITQHYYILQRDFMVHYFCNNYILLLRLNLNFSFSAFKQLSFLYIFYCYYNPSAIPIFLKHILSLLLG